MCVPDGIIVFLGGRCWDFSLHGAVAPGLRRVGGPAETFNGQGLLAQASGGIRARCYRKVHKSNVALAGLRVFAGYLSVYRRLFPAS